MKLFLILLGSICSLALYGQSVEIFGGANKNLFHGGNNGNYTYFRSDYHSGNGFNAGIGIDSIKIIKLKMRFSLQLDKYNGNFIAESNTGKAIYEKTTAEIDKLVLTLGAFPLNFNFKNKVVLNFGAEVSGLMGESVSGTYHYGTILNGGELIIKDLNEKYGRFSSRVSYGLKGRIAYHLAINKFYLIPQYSYYYGLSNEFEHFPEDTKSIRHYLCLGIKMKGR